MKNQDRVLGKTSKDKDTLPDYLIEVIQTWYREYQNLDELSAKLDTLAGEIAHMRHLVEQKISDLDRLFIPPRD